MNDEIKYLHLCGRLLAGKGIAGYYSDAIEADNILYGDFGMSSEDILENIKCNSSYGMCKYVCANLDNDTLFY